MEYEGFVGVELSLNCVALCGEFVPSSSKQGTRSFRICSASSSDGTKLVLRWASNGDSMNGVYNLSTSVASAGESQECGGSNQGFVHVSCFGNGEDPIIAESVISDSPPRGHASDSSCTLLFR